MILIIAFGNDLREDDGAGLLLAEKLEDSWRSQGRDVRRIAVQQLAPELAVEVAAPNIDAVIFVDARVVHETQGHAAVEVAALATASPAPPVAGHHVNPTLVRAYAGLLTDQPLPPFWLVTVPGVSFGHGQGLSRSAQEAIDHALNDEQSQLSQLIGGPVDW